MEFFPLFFMVAVGVSVLHPGVMEWFTFRMCDVVAFVCDVLVAVVGRVKSLVSAVKSSMEVR
jgi:hypothetical protein